MKSLIRLPSQKLWSTFDGGQKYKTISMDWLEIVITVFRNPHIVREVG